MYKFRVLVKYNREDFEQIEEFILSDPEFKDDELKAIVATKLQLSKELITINQIGNSIKIK